MRTVQDVRQKFADWPHGMLTTCSCAPRYHWLAVLYCSADVPEYGVFRQKTFQSICVECAL